MTGNGVVDLGSDAGQGIDPEAIVRHRLVDSAGSGSPADLEVTDSWVAG
jgi:hypothetical protein